MRPPATLAPLQNRSFRYLWASSIVANLGSLLQTVAAAWLMLSLTDSPLWVGAIAASTTLPVLFLSVFAGALADVADRRTILLAAHGVMGGAAAAMAILDVADLLTAPLLLALGLALGVGLAFNLPAWQAMVPDLVPRYMVASAVALNSVSYNVARAIGPALGGLIVATAGPGLAFTLNAASYVVVIAALATLPRRDVLSDEPEPITTAMAVGVRYVRFTTTLRWLVAVAAGFALTGAAVQAVLPNLTQDSLDGGAALYGVLLGAMGMGALGGAMSRHRASQVLGRRMVPLSIVAFGMTGAAAGLSQQVPLTVAAMVGHGVFWVWTLATLNATVQLASPDWVRGRTMSIYLLAFVGVLPVGSLLAGGLGDLVGVPLAVAGLSAGTIALGLAATRLSIPTLDQVVTPEPEPGWDLVPHADTHAGGPVMVVSTWVIDEADLAGFLGAMRALRLLRLRTGAYRWRLYRNADDPRRMTEVMVLPSWEDHVRQHRRIDAAGSEALRRARAFDRDGGPVTRHLVALDVTDPTTEPRWEQLVGEHDELHRQDDGSIPISGATPRGQAVHREP